MLYVIIGIAIFVIIWFVLTTNDFKKKQIKIEESSSDIDVALQKRFDSLTKMLDVATSYAKLEKETILEAIRLRKGMSIDEKIEAQKKMNNAFEKINLVAEQYPEMQVNEQFVILQKEIADVEEHIQASRRAYNANVSNLNQAIVIFPNSIIAKMSGINKIDFYKTEENKKEDPILKF